MPACAEVNSSGDAPTGITFARGCGSGSLVGTLPRLVGSLLICGPVQERIVRRDLIGACEVCKRCVH